MNGDATDLLTLQPPEALQALQGIPNQRQPEPPPPEEEGEGVTAEEAPPTIVPPQTMVVRGMHYGEHFGENNEGANYHRGRKLNDDDVALSPNVAEELGLELGDKVWVGDKLHTYNDVSAYTPERMTRDTVEVRNYPLDGKIQIRRALPEEISRMTTMPDIRTRLPSAMMASYMTGLDPTKITAEAVNRIIQPQIEQQRGLLATTGEPTGASLENWNLDQLNQQNEVAYSGQGDEYGEITPSSMGLESSGEQLPGGVLSGPGEGIPAPPSQGARIVDEKDGKLIWSNGVIGDPATGSIEFNVGGKTVKKYRDGRTQTFDTNSIYTDPRTGYHYDKTKPGMPRIVLEGEMADLKPGVTGEDALADLTEPQKNIIRMIGNYQLVLPPSAMRSASFLPYLARVSAYTNGDYSMMKAMGRQQMIKSVASMSPNTAGYTIVSANTMLDHLAQLYKAAQALPLKKWKKENSFINFLRDNENDPSVSNFQIWKTALLTELAKNLKNGVPDDSDMRRWEAGLNSSMGERQMQDAITKDFPDILQGRLNGFRFLYQNIMDKPYEKVDPKTGEKTSLISPKNQAWLKSIGYDGNVDPGEPNQTPVKEISNVQAGLPQKGINNVQGAIMYSAKHPEDTQLHDLLVRMGALPATAPSPTPATASK